MSEISEFEFDTVRAEHRLMRRALSEIKSIDESDTDYIGKIQSIIEKTLQLVIY